MYFIFRKIIKFGKVIIKNKFIFSFYVIRKVIIYQRFKYLVDDEQ